MKMHSPRLKDPLIAEARPVTILAPLIEESLWFARLRPDRRELIDRFMAGRPRIAVVHGAEDHPQNVGNRDLVRRLIQQIWAAGALPVEASQPVPSEELAQSLPGAHYAFLGRNVCASSLGALIESHGYDAAFVTGVSDKMLVGALRALVEADLVRQRRRARPVYGVFIPANIGREVRLDPEERACFEAFRSRLPEPEGAELFGLIDQAISPPHYERLKHCLDQAFHKRAILEAERDRLVSRLARRASTPGAGSAASESSVVTRLMLAAFGLVPRGTDILPASPDDGHLAHAVDRLIQGIQKRERRISAAHLVKANLQNALAVWTALGGDPTWLLHLLYVAEAAGARINPAGLNRRMARVPCLLSFNGDPAASVPGFAAESEAGGNSGIDTLMRTLSEKRFIDDRAATLDGPWMHRIVDARSANGEYLHSTITPYAAGCGLVQVRGNLCETALVRLGAGVDAELYDRKIYLADYFGSREEFRAAAAAPAGLLERIRRKTTPAALAALWKLNWEKPAQPGGPDEAGLRRLWDRLIEQGRLRVIFFVAGEGPRAAGMRQIGFWGAPAAAPLRRLGFLATDGRLAFADSGMSITHITPEALQGGGLAAVRAGDWVHLNLRKGELQLVAPARNPAGFRPLRDRELAARGEVARRVHDLERRRRAFLPSVRAILDSVSSAATGVSPVA